MRRRAPAAKLAGSLFLAGAVLVEVARLVWNRATSRAVEELRAGMDQTATGALPGYRQADLAELPPPVARYFAFALAPGQPRIRSARISWSGDFQSQPDGGWAEFTAEQHVTVDPPGFVWDARIRMLPLLQVRVRDGYSHGAGTMLGRVAAVVPVVDRGGTAEMAQSALARWLGEALWFPTALLPGGAVRWEAVDDSTARATVQDGKVQASGDFHFAPSGEVLRMTGMRYRDEKGKSILTPFEGRYGAFERRSGVMVPAEAEVAWQLYSGRFPYWRGRLGAIEYEPFPPAPDPMNPA